MAPDVDPSNLGEDQLHLSINARSDGGQPVMRGGERVICNLGAKITGLATHKIGPFKSLFSGAWAYDEEFATTPWRSNGLSDTSYVLGIFGSDLMCILVGSETVLQKFSGVATDPTQSIPLQPILGIPSGFDSITALFENEGTFLIALKGTAAAGTGTSAIFSYDGTTLSMELDAIDPCYAIVGLNDTAVAVFSQTGQVRVRSGGSWGALISPGAGTMVNCLHVPVNSVSYRGILWLPANNSDLFGLDQTGVLTQYPIATTGIDVGGVIRATTMLDGVMYFLWDTDPFGSADGTVYVGSYDGTTWTPKLKTVVLLQDGATGVWIRAYRGALVAAIDADFVQGYYFSPNGDPSGTWTLVPIPGTGLSIGLYSVIF